MARMILAAFAALCALAAVSGVSILGETPQLQLSEKEQQLQLLSADLDGIGSSPSVTLEAIEQALQVLLVQVEQTSDDAEAAMTKAQQTVEASALQITDKLSARVQEWVEKANEARVAVSDCVNGQEVTFADVVGDFSLQTRGCLTTPIKELYSILKQLRTAASVIQRLIQELGDAANACNKRTLLERLPCNIIEGGKFSIKATQLSTEVATLVQQATNILSSFQTNLALCTAKTSDSALQQGAAIVATTISCIKDKISPLSQLS